MAVSVDGSWQKRLGYNSLLGMVFLISVETGQVLDYCIKCLFCHECKKHPDATQAWKDTHAPNCKVNHEGSSGAMEKEWAIEMFTRSIDKYNLCYTTYVGDGDSSSFGKVKEAVVEKYGEEYVIEKEDCIDHKRLGSALRSYKNKKRGVPLSDGKGVGGHGRLTDAVCDHLQTYYGYAIRNNVGNIELIKKAIWAIFRHSIAGPPKETLSEQHEFCPTSDNMWCKYQRDQLNGTSYYNKSACLPNVFRGELEPIFKRLSSAELFSGVKKDRPKMQTRALMVSYGLGVPRDYFVEENAIQSRCVMQLHSLMMGQKGENSYSKI